MFRREGPARDARLNGLVAAYLAAVAGFVNAGGFILIGTFTSHVTGNVGRASYDLAHGDVRGALHALFLVASFFAGAFAASLVIEGSTESVPHAYGIALLLQSTLLGAFLATNMATAASAGSLRAPLLCAAMGMQNSLVTRLSGAVVRTTHLTGILTDLGIEAARWYRWQRARSRWPLVFRGRSEPERPRPRQSLLLATIALAFFLGGLGGGALTLHASGWAMAVPAVATLTLGLYALSQRTPTPNTST
jgi:uncharacterized membrane protein YoaK (UPF0700 family)